MRRSTARGAGEGVGGSIAKNYCVNVVDRIVAVYLNAELRTEHAADSPANVVLLRGEGVASRTDFPNELAPPPARRGPTRGRRDLGVPIVTGDAPEGGVFAAGRVRILPSVGCAP
jgi:hypothetical protein